LTNPRAKNYTEPDTTVVGSYAVEAPFRAAGFSGCAKFSAEAGLYEKLSPLALRMTTAFQGGKLF